MVDSEDGRNTSSDTSGFHQEYQIKWKDLDLTKFFSLNIALNFFVDGTTHPIDVIRTRIQIQDSSMVKTSFPKYTSYWEGVRQIVKQEGVRGLFKGFAVSEVGFVASHVLYYGTYEIAKQKLQEIYPPTDPNRGDTNVFVTTAVAGAIADGACHVIGVPFDIATTRLQIQGPLAAAKYTSGLGECSLTCLHTRFV
jgi:hypothetical protein